MQSSRRHNLDVDSCGWIDHFYRNACQAKLALIPPSFGPEDRNCLRAVRPGRLSLRSGSLLVEKSRAAAAQSKDYSFAWAVRLYVREQERQNRFLAELSTSGTINPSGDWRGVVIDKLPADLVMLLLGCRARVAARFFGALARRSACPQLRALYEQLESQELGQLRFAAFAGPKLSEKDRSLPSIVVRSAAGAVTLGIATRVWIRQRTRLRESGQTFTGFVYALLEPAA